MSPSSSVGGPAMLNDTTGPNSGSSSERTTHDTPGVAIRWTTKVLADSGASRSLRPSNASRSWASGPQVDPDAAQAGLSGASAAPPT